jgi:hypothetical protein
VVLLLDRLLDLEDQLGGAPHVVGAVHDAGAGRGELRVGDGGADAGAGLDVDLVSVAYELVHAGGGDRHPVLVVLDLARNSDLHAVHLSELAKRWQRRRCRMLHTVCRAQSRFARPASSRDTVSTNCRYT